MFRLNVCRFADTVDGLVSLGAISWLAALYIRWKTIVELPALEAIVINDSPNEISEMKQNQSLETTKVTLFPVRSDAGPCYQ